ncbi:MAG: benzoate-CoA ligase family protein [Candidatus Tectomicrobia bacterium]|nr:benzoate-CoA ligase family protein [Candidatus Tectomicrobia bacterium]
MSTSIPAEYLPAPNLWPERTRLLAELNYPQQLNAAQLLVEGEAGERRADRPAIYFRDEVITYGALARRVNRLGNAMKALGVGPGDRVVLRTPNRPSFIESWLATVKIGAVVVATMPLLRARELEYIANDSEAKIVIVEGSLYQEIGQARPKMSTVRHVLVHGEAPAGALAISDLTAEQPESLAAHPTTADDVALIAYTSGSTGVPKGCIHFHNDVLAIADSYARHILKPTPRDIFGGNPTMAFTFGLGALMVFPFRVGAAAVLMDAFTPELLLEAVKRYKMTLLFTAPTVYKLLVNMPGRDVRADVASLRLGVSAGEVLPAITYKQWVEGTGVELLDGIGATEILHIFISERAGQVKPGSTGVPVPGYEAKVVDENFAEAPRGTPGLLALRGPTGCRYWRKPERQAGYIHQGWNLPGDIYVQDEEGYFWYQCRNDDMIISSGYNIAGPEVENVMLEHPAVAEVAVVGKPDEKRGSIVKAFVVPAAGRSGGEALTKELQDFVKQQLAPYKYPREIEYVTALPRTETGKVRRVELRKKEQEAAGQKS